MIHFRHGKNTHGHGGSRPSQLSDPAGRHLAPILNLRTGVDSELNPASQSASIATALRQRRGASHRLAVAASGCLVSFSVYGGAGSEYFVIVLAAGALIYVLVAFAISGVAGMLGGRAYLVTIATVLFLGVPVLVTVYVVVGRFAERQRNADLRAMVDKVCSSADREIIWSAVEGVTTIWIMSTATLDHDRRVFFFAENLASAAKVRSRAPVAYRFVSPGRDLRKIAMSEPDPPRYIVRIADTSTTRRGDSKIAIGELAMDAVDLGTGKVLGVRKHYYLDWAECDGMLPHAERERKKLEFLNRVFRP